MTERTHAGEVPGVEGPAAHGGRFVRIRWDATDGRGRSVPELRCDGGNGTAGLFDSMPDPALRYVVGSDGPTVTDVNDAYAETFDVTPDVTGGLETRLGADLGRQESDEGAAGVDDVVELAESAAAESGARAVVGASTPQGERDYLARVVPLPETEAEAYGYLVLTDITAQRERTRNLIEERNRLDEFAAIVSHDLRNPLEVAGIQLEAARNRGDDAHFEKVTDAHERMEHIIEDVLTLARQGQVIDEPGDADLSLIAAEAWEAVSAPEATLVVEGDADLKADAGRLQELLENLFRNAVEHGSTSPGSQARGDAPEQAGQAVTVTVGRTAEGFYVADDGPGIPEEVRERIFEGGFSTNSDGTGLGLVIVERIAEAHGWTVGVGEAESGGARFDVSDVRFT